MLAAGVALPAAAIGDEVDDPFALRRRLTSRIDERRPSPPRSMELRGRPLILSGEFEVASIWNQQTRFDGDTGQQKQTSFEQDLQFELFYGFSEKLAAYLEAEFEGERDVQSSDEELASAQFFERGESWLWAGNLRNSGVDFQGGRISFEDERRWWWNEDLDALRLSYRTENGVLSFAVAQEMLPINSREDGIAPAQQDVLRLLGHASWNYADSHRIGLFSLIQRDHSSREHPGEILHDDAEDQTDADLNWFGARLSGAFLPQRAGRIAYWVDGAAVWGHERVSEYEDEARGRSRVDGVDAHGLSGWAIDAGATWHLALGYAPRITLGYAYGSGNPGDESAADRSFRQTGISDNEASFGSQRRFSSYGLILKPELSNLHIGTAGLGLSLRPKTSLDFVYHYYAQAKAATYLRSDSIDAELDGRSRGIGQSLDVVLAAEEWEHFGVSLRGSAFRSGDAFGADSGETAYQAFVALRLYF